ncbi:MAG TPA: ABC transporter ATP-binding protein [Acidimicrobiia bacterium]|jgi:ABC-2 type transport system ATP-binding protein
MADEAIRASQLTKSYGPVLALDGLDLEVRRGEIFGFLGPNGAGKTTAIRLFLDLLRPDSGRVTVLGLDPRSQGVELRKRIGYLPGDFTVEGHQTSRQLLTYLGNLRGGVPMGRIEALAERLALDLDTKIRNLSKGNRQKVGLIQAFMHEPELLILDEPTSGLDPLMAREFLTLSLEARDAGQTAFMSSHILSEVQQVADRAGIIRRGKLIAVDEVEALRAKSVRRVQVTFAEPIDSSEFAAIDGVSDLTIDDGVLRCRLLGEADPLVKAVARHRVQDFISEEPDLEELFFHYYTEEAGSVS